MPNNREDTGYYATDYADNIMWSEYCVTKCYPGEWTYFPFALIFPLVMLGVAFLGVCLTNETMKILDETIAARLRSDLSILHCICSAELMVVWAYLVLSRTFISVWLQPLMIAALFGPLIVSVCFTFVLSLAFRKLDYSTCFSADLGIKFIPSCESFSSLFQPLYYLVAHFVAFCFMSLAAVLFFVGCAFFGLFYQHVSMSICVSLALQPSDDDSRYFSYYHLRMCMFIHILAFAIPQLVMMVINTNTLPNKETAMATAPYIIFIILFSLECFMLVFHIVRGTKEGESILGVKEVLNKGLPTARDQPQTTSNATFTPQYRSGDETARPTQSRLNDMHAEDRFDSIELTKVILETNKSKQANSHHEESDDLEEPAWYNPSPMGRRSNVAVPNPNSSTLPMPSLSAPRGSSSARMSAAPSISNGSRVGLECAICFESNSRKKALGCGHVLCEACFRNIEADTNKCPFCKKDIVFVMDLFT